MSQIKSKEPQKDGEEKFWYDGNTEREKISEIENLNSRKSSINSCVFVCQHLNRSESTSVVENELINLDDVELSDEDTWLYTSPKDLTKEEKGLSPYKWLRKDVEDPTNQQLQMAKTALVSKLDELDILGCIQCSKLNPKNESAFSEDAKTNCDSFVDFISEQLLEDNADMMKKSYAEDVFLPENKPEIKLDSEEKHEKTKLKDVLERARLQEESLKLSSSKFFHDAARTFPRGNHSTSSTCSTTSNLTKPASVEALYANNGKQTSVSPPVNIAQRKFLQSSPNYSPFGSTASLNFPNDLHRSSLPNLNKGYNSLKLKRPKRERASESQIQCPLPIYPKAGMNAPIKSEVTQPFMPKGILRCQVSTYRESQTLPSSYRTRSKNGSINKVEPLFFSSRRRESSPSPVCQKNNFIVHPFRQESSPCIVQQSPKKNIGMLTVHGASMPILQNARSLSVNQLSPESDCEHRSRGSARQSFSKRQPLSSVHNCSLKQEDYSIIHNNAELRKSSLPSKIPSPSNRSGIPVPSVQCAMDKSSPHKKSWSQDFY